MAEVVNQAYDEVLMKRKFIGGAVEAAVVAAGLARHVIWYLSYQMDGTARHEPRT
jgi:hypothetical protein